MQNELPAGTAIGTDSVSRLPRSRYLVIAGLFALSLITYIDRAAISSAKGAIGSELALSDQALGAVFSAFALGYAVAQIPAGWLADRAGPRRVLAALVSLWSVMTLLTGTASRLGTLLVIRFLFGVAEAGAFPGSARAFYNWLPSGERGLANGILFSGGLLGGALAFPICVWLLQAHGWRTAFYLLAIPGLLWAVLWMACFRDHPRIPIPGSAGLAEAGAGGFSQVFHSKPMVLAMAQYFAGNFTFFICMSWMHPYLKETFDLSLAEAAAYTTVPLLFGSTANWISGFVVDLLYRRGHRAWSRRLPGMTGFVLAAAGIFSVSLVDSPSAAVACFALATLGVEITISPSWAYCMDIGGKNSGAVSGAMNMMGNLGAFASANAFPYLFGLTGSASAYFCTAAVLDLLAVFIWFQMRATAKA